MASATIPASNDQPDVSLGSARGSETMAQRGAPTDSLPRGKDSLPPPTTSQKSEEASPELSPPTASTARLPAASDRTATTTETGSHLVSYFVSAFPELSVVHKVIHKSLDQSWRRSGLDQYAAGKSEDYDTKEKIRRRVLFVEETQKEVVIRVLHPGCHTPFNNPKREVRIKKPTNSTLEMSVERAIELVGKCLQQASDFYREQGELCEDGEVGPHLGFVRPEACEEHQPSLSALAVRRSGHKTLRKVEAGLNGRQLARQTGKNMESDQISLCALCGVKWSTTHNNSRNHKENVKRLIGTHAVISRSVKGTSPTGAEPPVLPYKRMWSIDLYSLAQWPPRLQLVRLEVVIWDPTSSAAEPKLARYGLLMVPPEPEDNTTFNSFSLEWPQGPPQSDRDQSHHIGEQEEQGQRRHQEGDPGCALGSGCALWPAGVVRFQVYSFPWREMRWKILAGKEPGMDPGQDPEQLLKDFHEAMWHDLLPNLEPPSASGPRPSGSAILVPLRGATKEEEEERDPRAGEEFYLDWEHVQEVVHDHSEKNSRLGQSTEEDAAPPIDLFRDWHSNRGRRKPSKKFPFWLPSVIHRWFRLQDLAMAALKYAPIFPALNPLALETALSPPSTGLMGSPFEYYRRLGRQVLSLVLAVTAHARLPCGTYSQMVKTMAALRPRDVLMNQLRAAFPPNLVQVAMSEMDLRLWNVPGVRCRERRSLKQYEADDEDFADIAEALIAAYFLSEGGFFSVCQFLKWLDKPPAVSTNSVPTNSVTTTSAPTNSVTTNSVTTNSVPTNSLPTNRVPSNSVPAPPPTVSTRISASRNLPTAKTERLPAPAVSGVQTSSAEAKATAAATEIPGQVQPWEEGVIGHLLCGIGQPFRGRTPSYLEFRELKVDGEKVFEVLYSDFEQPKFVQYRRSHPHQRVTNPSDGKVAKLNRANPQERRATQVKFFSDDNTECEPIEWSDWEDLAFSQKTHFLSHKNGREVPNKVTSWLIGKPSAPLVTIKPYINKGKTLQINQTPPEILQLQETRDGLLRVRYKNDDRLWRYKRSDCGDLGHEMQEGESEGWGPLIYSEFLKTLKSAKMKRPLPLKVTEWIHYRKSLTFLVSPKKVETADDSEEGSTKPEDKPHHSLYDNKAVWKLESLTLEYRVVMEDNGCGLRFLEKKKDGTDSLDNAQGFIFCEENRLWLSPTLSSDKLENDHRVVPIPLRIVEWARTIAQRTLKEPTEAGFRKQYFQAPWIQVPHYVKSFLPRCVDLEELESEVLNYSFQNGMLLAEAVTHPSAEQASTPSYMRLALIGRQCVEVLTSQVMARKLGLPTHTTRIQPLEDSALDVQESGQTFTVAASRASLKGGVDEVFMFPRPPATRGDQPYPTVEQLNKLTNGFDNHAMYAFACLEMGLWKFLNYDSDDLRGAIQQFKSFREKWEDDSMLPIALTLADPPRALSDLFYAVAGAVLLDSDWVNFSRVYEAVLLESLFSDQMFSAMVEMMRDDGDKSCDPVFSLQEYAAEKGYPLAVRLVQPTDPSLEVEPIGAPDEENIRARVSSGLHDRFAASVWLNGVQLPQFEEGNSPRTTLRKCAYKVGSGIRTTDWKKLDQVLDSSPGDVTQTIRGFYLDPKPNPFVRDVEEVAYQATQEAELQNLAQPCAQDSDTKEFYCPHCNMTLNGPTQWEDHKIGKKHRKNTNKAPTKSTMPNPTPHVASIRGEGKPRATPDGDGPSQGSITRLPQSATASTGPVPIPAVPPSGLSTAMSTRKLRDEIGGADDQRHRTGPHPPMPPPGPGPGLGSAGNVGTPPGLGPPPTTSSRGHGKAYQSHDAQQGWADSAASTTWGPATWPNMSQFPNYSMMDPMMGSMQGLPLGSGCWPDQGNGMITHPYYDNNVGGAHDNYHGGWGNHPQQHQQHQ